MMVRVGADFSSLISGSKSAASATQKWADQTGNAFAKVEASSKSLERTQSALGALGGKLMRLVSFTAITAGIGKCIEAASDLTEVQNVVDKAFGNLSYRADEFAKTAISSFGLTELQAKQFSANFMAMGKSMGIAEGQAADLAIQLAGMTGDVASFFNLDQETAYTKLKSIFTGETQSLKELGVVMTETNLKEFALAQGITTSYSAMSQAEKVMLRYNYVMHTLAYTQGDFADTSTQWANNVRVLKNQFVSLISVLGKGFIAVLNPVVTVLNTILGHLVGFANAVSDVFSSVFGTANTQLSAGLGSVDASGLAIDLSDIDSAASHAADSVGSVGKATKGTTSAAKELQRQLMGFDKITKLTAQTSSSGSSSGSSGGGSGGTSGGGSGSSGLGVTASTAAAAGSVLDSITEKTDAFSGAMGKFRDYLAGLDFSPMKDAWDKLAEAGGKLGDVLKGGLQWGLENVLAPLGKWTIEEAAPAAMNALASGMTLFADATLALEPALGWTWDNLVRPMAELAGQEVVDGLNGVAAFFDDFDKWLNNDADGSLEGFSKGYNVISTLTDWLANATGNDSVGLGGVARKLDTSMKAAAIVLALLGNSDIRLVGTSIDDDGFSGVVGDFDSFGGNGGSLTDGLPGVTDIKDAIRLKIAPYLDPSPEALSEETVTGFGSPLVSVIDKLKTTGQELAGQTVTDYGSPLVSVIDKLKTTGQELAGQTVTDYGSPLVSVIDKLKTTGQELASQAITEFGSPAASLNVGLNQRNWTTVGAWVSSHAGDAVNKAVGLVKNNWTSLQAYVNSNSGGAVNKIIGLAKNKWTSLQAYVNSNSGGAVNKFVGLAKNHWTSLQTYVGSNTGGAVNKPVGVTQGWKGSLQAALGLANAVISVKAAVSQKLGASDLINKKSTVEINATTSGVSKIKQLATIKFAARGGIVDRATLLGGNLIAGEAGREAIIPLENHTEWIDRVATRLAQAMTGAGGGRETANVQPIYLVLPDGRILGRTMVDWLHGEANQGRYPLHDAGAV